MPSPGSVGKCPPPPPPVSAQGVWVGCRPATAPTTPTPVSSSPVSSSPPWSTGTCLPRILSSLRVCPGPHAGAALPSPTGRPRPLPCSQEPLPVPVGPSDQRLCVQRSRATTACLPLLQRGCAFIHAAHPAPALHPGHPVTLDATRKSELPAESGPWRRQHGSSRNKERRLECPAPWRWRAASGRVPAAQSNKHFGRSARTGRDSASGTPQRNYTDDHWFWNLFHPFKSTLEQELIFISLSSLAF